MSSLLVIIIIIIYIYIHTLCIYIYISIIANSYNSFGYVLVTKDDIDVQKEIMHILKF